MIAFIEENRAVHGVEPICKVLPIAPSTYRAHVAQQADPAKQSTRMRSDAALMIEIRRVFEANFCVYGVRKVWRQLRREGIEVARCTVARLMHAMGLQGVKQRPKVSREQRPKVFSWSAGFQGLFAVFEAERVVAGLQDVAVVGDAIKQGCGHFGIAEHRDPLGE